MPGAQAWGYYPAGEAWLPLQVNASGQVVADLSNINLNDLADVSISSVGHGDYLYYDSATSLWKNRRFPTGATVPTSPSAGELFLHTPTGRKVLLEYDGSSWIPIISLGTMTVYVDKTDGTDSIDKGGAVDSGAFATVQYAIDQIPSLFGGDVTVNINAETYSESVVIRGKAPTGNYKIKLQGTLTSQETGTADSMTQGTGGTQGTLTDTGAFAGDSYANMILHVATLDEYRVIDSHTDDVITIVDCFTGSGAYGYTVYDWGTEIDSITLGDGQMNVEPYDIYVLHDASVGLHLNAGASAKAYRCKFNNTTGGKYPVYAGIGAWLEQFRCFTYNDRSYSFLTEGGKIDAYGTKFYPNGNTACGPTISAGGSSVLGSRSGNIVVDGEAGANKATSGVWVAGNSFCNMWALAANGYNRIRNCDTGVYAFQGGQVFGTSNNQYAGNTADETAVAASYGYID